MEHYFNIYIFIRSERQQQRIERREKADRHTNNQSLPHDGKYIVKS